MWVGSIFALLFFLRQRFVLRHVIAIWRCVGYLYANLVTMVYFVDSEKGSG